MKLTRFAGIAALVAACAPSASAGLVGFSSINSSVASGTPVLVDVSIDTAFFGRFQSATTIIGSDTATGFANFVYDVGWTAKFGTDEYSPDYTASLYGAQVRVGGDAFPGSVHFAQQVIPLGSFTIDTTGMAPGVYSIGVDHDIDFDSTVVDPIGDEGSPAFDDLFGTFEFTITPEPATLVLLALGGVAALRRVR